VPTNTDWLADNLGRGDGVGIDPCLLSIEEARTLEARLSPAGIKVRYIEENLVDLIWRHRPVLPETRIRIMHTKYAGESFSDKLNRVRERMAAAGTKALVLSALDSIAWLFNLRGKDVPYNPVFISYAVVTDKDACIFINPSKVPPGIKRHLRPLTDIRPYEKIREYLGDLAKKSIWVWVDPAGTSHWIASCLKGRAKLYLERSPITDFKACKNEVELKGFREAHIQDGVAMVRFLKWLEENVPAGHVTEIRAQRALDRLRTQGKHFVGLSFNTISSYGDHGAIVHYRADQCSDRTLEPAGIYLIDSGGHYLNGTTDITRTLCLGKRCASEQKEMFTRVLKGHITLAQLSFPRGFTGKQIEVLARKPLWDAGKNYGHSTGHGIGHYLNVHEGPVSMSPRGLDIPLEPGNVLSNEPGYYRAGQYGIRVENVVVVVKNEDFSEGEQEFLKFETITLCPIDLKLIDARMLSDEELAWLNQYHRHVYAILSPLLDRETALWLKRKTRPISRK
jgi:Xaa-Pro aminopeptidase